MSVNDGGPAFPFDEKEGDGTHYHSHGGMALRDWFAGQALAGFCANPSGPHRLDPEIGFGLVDCDTCDVADYAYDLADAMLAARKVGARP